MRNAVPKKKLNVYCHSYQSIGHPATIVMLVSDGVDNSSVRFALSNLLSEWCNHTIESGIYRQHKLC